MVDAPESIPDLDELAAWCRTAPKGAWIGPNDLMRPPWHLTRNAACSALEALEARGDLEKVPGQALAWKPAPAPHRPTRGYSLPLSPSEHGALLRLLTWALQPSTIEHRPGHLDTQLLRQIRSRLKRGARP